MQRSGSTSTIYVATAVACSVFMLSRNAEVGGRWSVLLLVWLFVCAVPLSFVFAYPRFLFAHSALESRRKYAALINGAGAVTATVLFSLLATPFWKNPVRDVDDSIPHVLVPLAVLVVFLVAAIFLLLKNHSGLATIASILLWPYWLFLALMFVDRWFQDSGIHAAYYFLCFCYPNPICFRGGGHSSSSHYRARRSVDRPGGCAFSLLGSNKRQRIRQCLPHVQPAGQQICHLPYLRGAWHLLGSTTCTRDHHIWCSALSIPLAPPKTSSSGPNVARLGCMLRRCYSLVRPLGDALSNSRCRGLF